MEKETELYLINRIKELEEEIAYLKRKSKEAITTETIKKRTEIPITYDLLNKSLDNHFLAELDIGKLLAKSRALDTIQDILVLEPLWWEKEGKYQLFSHMYGCRTPISKEQFTTIYEGLK